MTTKQQESHSLKGSPIVNDFSMSLQTNGINVVALLPTIGFQSFFEEKERRRSALPGGMEKKRSGRRVRMSGGEGPPEQPLSGLL